MNYNKRQLQRKKKTEQYLQQLVDEQNGRSYESAPKKNTAGTPAVKRRVLKTASQDAKSSKKNKAVSKPVKKENTFTRFSDTIENYRTKPMSKKKKKRRNRFFYSLIAIMSVGLIICSLTIFFKITAFKVNGCAKYSNDKIIASSGIQYDDNIFRMNKFEIQKKIEKELPYVKKVEIKRSLPSTIVFNITETEPAAAVPVASGFAIIDSESKILEIVSQDPGLLEIKGAVISNAPEPGVTAQYTNENEQNLIYDLLTALDNGGLVNKVTSLDVTKRYELSFVYNGNITCVLGDSQELNTKIEMINVVIEKNPESVAAVIDATDADKVYYRPENQKN